MKKVIKVSIGNIAFTLEEDAHKVLNDYLSSLSSHYSGNPNGQEIIDGIEERIAELLTERGGKDGVIARQTAEEVIFILGRPEDIDNESGEGGSSSSSSNMGSSQKVRKKFYRDPDNRVIGGVCSGLANYCEQDALLFRVLFVIFALGFTIFGWHFGGFGFVFLLYIVLWIVVPEAKTTEQRCAMRGESTSYQDIQKNIEKGAKVVADRAREVSSDKDFWHSVGRVFAIFFGFIFTIVGLSGVVSCIVAFFGVQFWDFCFPIGVLDTISFFSGGTKVTILIFKILTTLAIFLPFIGILYGGIQMLFDFKSPRWRPGLVIFIIWIISILGLAGLSAGLTSRYWDAEDKVVTVPIEPVSDTLYVEFAQVGQWKDEKVSIKADRREYNLFFIDNSDRDDVKLVFYPEFRLDRDENNDSHLVIKTNIFDETMSLSELQDVAKMDFYSFDGKTLMLEPMIIANNKSLKEYKRRVKLYVDDKTTVIVKDPAYHEFNRSYEYSNMKMFRSNINFDFDF